jgi:hypothetical protein
MRGGNMKKNLHCTIYQKQGIGTVGRISDHDGDFGLTFKVATLIGESIAEIKHMAHGQYGVPYTNMHVE